MDSLAAIRIFNRVVETGNFTKAALSLNIPLATASKLVQSLEIQLQLKLLERTTRKVTVTPDGAAYYDSTAHLVSALDEINRCFAFDHKRHVGKIRVETSASFASAFLIPALPDFHERYPHVKIDLGVGDRINERLGENADCAIRGGPLSDDTREARKVGESEWITCVSPAYLARHGVPQCPEDLELHHQVVRFISERAGDRVLISFGKGATLTQISPRSFLSVEDDHALVAAALAGLGIIHSVAFQVRAHIHSGALIPVLASWRPAAYPYHVTFATHRRPSLCLRLFMTWLGDTFGCRPDGPDSPRVSE